MSIIEHFTLRAASRAAAGVGDETRRAAQDALDRSASRASEADTLWAAGQAVEGLRAAVDSLSAAIEAARGLVPAGADLEAALSASGLSPDERATVRAAHAARRAPFAAPLAPLDGALFEESQRAARALQRGLETRLMDAEGRDRTRKLRRHAALAALVGVGCLIAIPWVAPRSTVEANASAYRVLDTVETWPPENAIDRDETSQWELPPGEGGWLELSLSPPRRVSALRIMNAHDNHVRDPHRADRRPINQASREIRIHAFAGGRRVAEVDATLDRINDWRRQTIPLSEDGAVDGIDRIRIEVRSFYGDGGGLAEVEVLE